jgi:hypothetical protein
MIEFMLLLMATPATKGLDKNGCPDMKTLEGRILFEEGKTCPKWIAEDNARKKAQKAQDENLAGVIGKPLSPKAEQQIKSLFFRILIDGSSAQYLFPLVSDEKVYCGFVNSKNRYGGYVGWSRFYADFDYDGSIKNVEILDNEEPNVATTFACDARGYPTSPLSM